MLPILGVLIGTVVGGAVSLIGFGTGIGDIMNRRLNELFQSKVLTPDVVIACWYKGLITQEQYLKLMTYLGFDESRAMLLRDSSANNLNLGEILTLWYRWRDTPGSPVTVNDFWLKRRLMESGYNTDRIPELLEANRTVPTLQDTIVFAVRDVYETESVQSAGLLNGLPEAFVTEAKQRGLNRDDALKYWAAHWQLPSMTAVYEMYHRFYPGSGHTVEFTEEDMNVFFNLADIAPGYRERLKQLSYNPLTRVDIRRMYALGQYGDGENARPGLIRDYRQIGYSPFDANRLATFTIRSYSPKKKRLTPSQILTMYADNVWGESNREKALSLLKEGGYDESVGNHLLDYEDRKTIDAVEAMAIEAIQARYLLGEIESEGALNVELLKIPVTNEKAQSLIKQFKTEREKRLTRLSKNEYDSFYRSGLITENQYRKFLRDLGFTKEDINLLVSYKGNAKTNPDTLPSKENIIEWYSNEWIEPAAFVYYLRELGFRDEFIPLLAKGTGRELPDSVTSKLRIVKVNYEEILSS